MDAGIIDVVARAVERVGIPAGLIFAGLYLLDRLVRGVGPAVAGFLTKLTDKMTEHTVDHARLDGKLDVHHEKTAAEIRKVAATVRSTVDSARGEVLAAIDATADRILDDVRRSGSRSSIDNIPAPRSSRRVSPLDEETQQSEKDR